MKLMLKGCIVICLAFTFGFCYGQKEPYRLFPDSIRIELSDAKAIIVISLKKADRDISIVESFPDSLALWSSAIEKSIARITEPRRVQIGRGLAGTEIKILEAEKETRLTMNLGMTTELLPPGWELFIEMKDFKAYVYVQDFDGLKKISRASMQPAMEKLKEEFKKSPCYRRRSESRIIVKEEKVAYSRCECEGPFDFLVLNASSGVGIVGDKFYPELNFDVALKFSRSNGISRNKVIFSYNNLFFAERKTDGGFQVFPSSFISAAFNRNIDSGSKTTWLGFGAGYLIYNSGSYFKGNTMKFFINKDVGKVRIVPEVYLTDDFKSYMVGVKFNFTF
jgi:hypothetical protein